MIRSYDNLTIGKWQQIVALNTTDLDHLDKGLELLKILTSHDEATLLQMEISIFKKLLSDTAFLNESYKGKAVDSFTIDGVKYNINWRVNEKTAGQFIDISKLTESKDLINSNLHRLMAIICIPEGEKYDGNIEERAQLFSEKLTMDIVFPITAFFLKVWEKSEPLILDYFSKKMTKWKEIASKKLASSSIGHGSAHSTRSAEVTSPSGT